MALDANIALISLANAKTQLKITGSGDDTLLEDFVNQVSAMFNSICGRHLLQKTHTEYYDGSGEPELILRNFPIISVTSLYNDTELRLFNATSEVDVSADVIIQKEAGILRLWNNEVSFLAGHANVKVVYSAGYAAGSVPYDLQNAARTMVAHKYKQYQGQTYNRQAQTVGETTTTFLDEEIPKDVMGILKRYKVGGYYAPGFAYADD